MPKSNSKVEINIIIFKDLKLKIFRNFRNRIQCGIDKNHQKNIKVLLWSGRQRKWTYEATSKIKLNLFLLTRFSSSIISNLILS